MNESDRNIEGGLFVIVALLGCFCLGMFIALIHQQDQARETCHPTKAKEKQP